MRQQRRQLKGISQYKNLQQNRWKILGNIILKKLKKVDLFIIL